MQVPADVLMYCSASAPASFTRYQVACPLPSAPARRKQEQSFFFTPDLDSYHLPCPPVAPVYQRLVGVYLGFYLGVRLGV